MANYHCKEDVLLTTILHPSQMLQELLIEDANRIGRESDFVKREKRLSGASFAQSFKDQPWFKASYAALQKEWAGDYKTVEDMAQLWAEEIGRRVAAIRAGNPCLAG